jgi:methionyl-tRNA synthetase
MVEAAVRPNTLQTHRTGEAGILQRRQFIAWLSLVRVSALSNRRWSCMNTATASNGLSHQFLSVSAATARERLDSPLDYRLMASSTYITTPIYYVNDRPHIGHCYTTGMADCLARFSRLICGSPADTFFLTGTDEHADKVVTSAAANGMTPLQWADRNAAEFEAAFKTCSYSYDDFVRTTQPRHKEKVLAYITALQAKGDIYLGEYSGWWDASQEEYLTETVAKEANFLSPVTGKPLVKRIEKNYFFKLSAYQDRLKAHIDANPNFILPEARRNEVLGRLRDGLSDIPISRGVTSDPASQWGILMPEDPTHRIYVWIDALFNYLSVVDTPERSRFWPAHTHLMAKDILWFHAVIWPCMLMALDKPLPRAVFAHSYWVREGVKMSKSLGNFVTIEVMKAYIDRFSLDGLRWYLFTQGPNGTTDADFSHARFVEVFNADLANGIGNCASRVGNMIDKYFAGELPQGVKEHVASGQSRPLSVCCAAQVAAAIKALDTCDIGDALTAGIGIIREVDQFINITAPFKLAKTVEADPAAKNTLADILFTCAEAIRIASLLLSPAIPDKMSQLWTSWHCTPAAGIPLAALAQFAGPHGFTGGSKITKGEILFMRADPTAPAPA